MPQILDVNVLKIQKTFSVRRQHVIKLQALRAQHSFTSESALVRWLLDKEPLTGEEEEGNHDKTQNK